MVPNKKREKFKQTDTKWNKTRNHWNHKPSYNVKRCVPAACV